MRAAQLLDQRRRVAVAVDAGGGAQRGTRLLEFGEVVVVVEQEVVDLVGRRDRAGAGGVLVEEGRERLRDLGQPRAFVADDRDEALLLRGVELGGAVQDLGRRADRSDLGQHPVHGLAEERVLVQPVRQRVHRLPAIQPRAVQPHQRARPVALPADQAVRAGRIQPQVAEQRLAGQFGQVVDQPPLGGAVDFLQREPERIGDALDQHAADVALVALDQVQVRGRDAHLRRQSRLGDAERAPALA